MNTESTVARTRCLFRGAVLIITLGLIQAGPADVDAPIFYEFTLMRNVTASYPLTAQGLLCAGQAGEARMVIYWRQPEMPLLATDLLTCSEFLFLEDTIYGCWYHAGKTRKWETPLPLSQAPALALTNQTPLDTYLQAIIHSMVRQGKQGQQHTRALYDLFKDSRSRNIFQHTILPENANLDQAKHAGAAHDYRRVFDLPPLGRVYQKRVEKDGSVEWCVGKALLNKEMLRLVLRPGPRQVRPDIDKAFDPATLGQWQWVPEVYRLYWECKGRFNGLQRGRTTSVRPGELVAYMDAHTGPSLPLPLRHAWYWLRYRIALLTENPVTITRTARDYFEIIRRTEQPIRDTIIDVGRIAMDARPVLTDTQINSLIAPMLEVLASSPICRNPCFIEELAKILKLRRWFWLGNRFAKSIRSRGLGSKALDELTVELEQRLLAQHVADPLPNELTGTVATFLQHAGAKPAPTGTMTPKHLRKLLHKALSQHRADQPAAVTHEQISQVLDTVQALSGNGPWQGDPRTLESAIERFNDCLEPHLSASHQRVTLAVFIALSFYDTSSTKDHLMLIKQFEALFHGIKNALTNRIHAATGYDLPLLDTTNEPLEQFLHECWIYVDDPLWPMFKFPLSRNEYTRLQNQMVLLVKKQLRYLPPHKPAEQAEMAGMIQEFAEYRLLHVARAMLHKLVAMRSSGSGVTSQYEEQAIQLKVDEDIIEDKQSESQAMIRLKKLYLGHRTISRMSAGPGPCNSGKK